MVSGDAFTTNFNTGHGLVYAQNGEISNSHEWANLNLQDILPTWQFWFETAGSKLGAEFDYGTQYQRYLEDGTPTAFDFDLVDPTKAAPPWRSTARWTPRTSCTCIRPIWM